MMAEEYLQAPHIYEAVSPKSGWITGWYLRDAAGYGMQQCPQLYIEKDKPFRICWQGEIAINMPFPRVVSADFQCVAKIRPEVEPDPNRSSMYLLPFQRVAGKAG